MSTDLVGEPVCTPHDASPQEVDIERLHGELLELRAARERLEVLRFVVASKRTEFENSIADLTGKLKAAVNAVATMESEVKGNAVSVFTDNPDLPLKFTPGIAMRRCTDVAVVYDEAQALRWAKEHDCCLQLDKKTFEAVAKAAPDALGGLVTITTTTRVEATIATDLGAALRGLDGAR